MKETFIVRTEWAAAIMELEPADQATIFQNLFHFHSGNENLINLNNLPVKLIWRLIEPSLKRQTGEYEIIELDDLPTHVYFIKLTSSEESFVKIGISCNYRSRLAYFRRNGYKVEVIKLELYQTRVEAELREYDLHQVLSRFRCWPSKSFFGHTECFTIESIAFLPK